MQTSDASLNVTRFCSKGIANEMAKSSGAKPLSASGRKPGGKAAAAPVQQPAAAARTNKPSPKGKSPAARGGAKSASSGGVSRAALRAAALADAKDDDDDADAEDIVAELDGSDDDEEGDSEEGDEDEDADDDGDDDDEDDDESDEDSGGEGFEAQGDSSEEEPGDDDEEEDDEESEKLRSLFDAEASPRVWGAGYVTSDASGVAAAETQAVVGAGRERQLADEAEQGALAVARNHYTDDLSRWGEPPRRRSKWSRASNRAARETARDETEGNSEWTARDRSSDAPTRPLCRR